jgi:NADH:ubiquinone oxidoreductase subunit E
MKTNIIICQGSSCFSRGNKENLAVIQKYLKDNVLEVNVSFKGQLCSEKCTQSPIIIINAETFTEVDEKKTLDILTAHFNR